MTPLTVNPPVDKESVSKHFESWQIDLSRRLPQRPPYERSFAVTPLSVFGEEVWRFPRNWASINNRKRLKLNFAAICNFKAKRIGLEHKDMLQLQLKQALLGITVRRDVLMEHRVRVRYPRPTGIYNSLGPLRRVFCAAKAVGCKSLSDITPAKLLDIEKLLSGATDAEPEVSAFQDLMLLSRRDLIEDGLLNYAFELRPEPATIPDSSRENGWQPIADEHLGTLLGTASVIVDCRMDIASAIGRAVSASSDHVDLHSVLPASVPIPPKAHHKPARFLFETYQAAAGSLICFHTGMRVAELMSLTDGWVSRTSDGSMLVDEV